MNTLDTLKSLCEAVGVAGNENSDKQAIAQTALLLLKEYAPDASLDCHGSVVGFIGGRDNDKPTILLDAHIDQVGLVVTHIDSEGFVKTSSCGGVDRRVLAAQPVTLHGKEKVKGIVCTLPPHVKKEKSVIKGDSIWIDTGLTKEKVSELVSLGDVATVDGEFTHLLNGRISAPALDDRAGVCAILSALNLLKNSSTGFNIAVSFSVQEELGCRGAIVTAYNTEPDYAIVVDVSYGLSPGGDKHKCGELGKGPMIGYAPSLNRGMFEGLKKTADEWELPYQLEIMNRDTGGTNADTITVVKGGVRTALISIPLRYMHTPVETADLSDIETAGQLIAAFVEGYGV
jgi:endoglucanase